MADRSKHIFEDNRGRQSQIQGLKKYKEREIKRELKDDDKRHRTLPLSSLGLSHWSQGVTDPRLDAKVTLVRLNQVQGLSVASFREKGKNVRSGEE